MTNDRKQKHAVAVSAWPGWKNVELLKDCGLIPYLLYKNHDFSCTMVGKSTGEYPYLTSYVNGIQMDFLETGEIKEKQDYVLKHAEEIDLLILRGAYLWNYYLAKAYKLKNPNGKIYVGLDANSAWMDRIEWDDRRFSEYMDCCDVIATSCRAMQRHLNEKWPWKIEYIPNGYYKFEHQYDVPDFSAKENIILTVSRLGTEQKATNILLEAFALIAHRIPDWTLRLVGSVDEKFKLWLTEYFDKNPDLRDRITFTGAITEKAALYREYAKAKIFALPSTFEGGTPNVVAEALHAGCAMAVTKFDAYEDATDNGQCGCSCDINDVNGFAEGLLSLSSSDNLLSVCKHSYQYALRNYNMETIVTRLNDLLYGENYE